ncbi:MAG: branched-chain amino acid ABC transporter permease [Oxalobacteraceae bacterium]|jgi:branched-chain amino acid transport system permease protein|nr:branched-chain amino acid ABC transporter permease [Oxalobacteraceae bacterium]
MSLQTISYTPINLGRWLVWTSFGILLALAPYVFPSGGSLSLLSLMGTTMIFALSYNMLLGQSGMLSFGHAVYSGLGAFFAIHAINLSTSGSFFIPLSFVPLIGGIAGLAFGILFGYVTTKRSGTTFSMISLGIVELVFACSLMFPGFFGGEGGISADRVFGKPFLGISYGPQIQVYYLIAAWLFISTAAMFAISHTPLGRIANAVRDNPERAEFIGYDTQRVRYLMLILSGFFAGISGGLTAINFEIVSAENVSAARSGAVLLFTFIGGIGFFFGPLLGAVIGVLLTVMLSEVTKAWLLYLGIFFIMMVMYAPGGLASLIMMNFRLMMNRLFTPLIPLMIKITTASLILFLSLVTLVEMTYHWSLESAQGSIVKLFGTQIDTAQPLAWIIASALFAGGAVLFIRSRPAYMDALGEANAEIERRIARGAA